MAVVFSYVNLEDRYAKERSPLHSTHKVYLFI